MFENLKPYIQDRLLYIIIKHDRSKAANLMEEVYNAGELQAGDRIKVTYERPSLLRNFYSVRSDEEVERDRDTTFPCYNVGLVMPGGIIRGWTYIRLDDEESGFTLDPTFNKWEKL